MACGICRRRCLWGERQRVGTRSGALVHERSDFFIGGFVIPLIFRASRPAGTAFAAFNGETDAHQGVGWVFLAIRVRSAKRTGQDVAHLAILRGQGVGILGEGGVGVDAISDQIRIHDAAMIPSTVTSTDIRPPRGFLFAFALDLELDFGVVRHWAGALAVPIFPAGDVAHIFPRQLSFVVARGDEVRQPLYLALLMKAEREEFTRSLQSLTVREP